MVLKNAFVNLSKIVVSFIELAPGKLGCNFETPSTASTYFPTSAWLISDDIFILNCKKGPQGYLVVKLVR
jgi:hypothetical protein